MIPCAEFPEKYGTLNEDSGEYANVTNLTEQYRVSGDIYWI